MNGDDVADTITARLTAPVRTLRPRPDPEALLQRIERRRARDRRLFAGALVLVVVAAGGLGLALGRTGAEGETAVTSALQDGTPRSASDDLAFEPRDPDLARAGVIEAFEQAYTGGTPASVRNDAIQRGEELEPLSQRVRERAERFGYTEEQLGATTVEVADVRFIDESHAIVRFTLSVPQRGPTLVDRIGYAVFTEGRWKVSLRTACDLLSLAGLGAPCPPVE